MAKPAWERCEICRNLPEHCTAHVLLGEILPASVDRLERREDIVRCPLCRTFYYHDDGNDPHHYMPDDQMLVRIEARRYLAAHDAGRAIGWLRELDAEARK